MQHVMLDIETLATTPDAVVLSFGAVKFDTSTGEVVGQHSGCFDLQDQFDHGRRMSSSTLKWWLKQNPDILGAQIAVEGHRYDNKAILERLVAFVGKTNVWGNGATFDNTIIAHMCTMYGVECWEYKQDRCFRTLSRTFDPAYEHKERSKATHSALHDALDQTQWMLRIIEVHDLEGYL